jgi:hypothetical protein
MKKYPMLVALCGAPESGKSTIQNILTERYGMRPVDDFKFGRDAVCLIYGLTQWHVTTQEGKRTVVDVCGEPWEVRKILGEFGNRLEAMHGPDFIPETAIRYARAEIANSGGDTPILSFGSVRREQGRVYKREGGIVIEVTRSGAKVVNEFDHYNKELVDITIHNPVPVDHRFANEAAKEQALNALLKEVAGKLDPIFPVIGKLAA